MLQIGAQRTLIRVRTRKIGMLGYGAMQNLANHALSDLYVRSCVFQDESGDWLAFANAEICFVTQSIHQEVLKRLKLEFPELAPERIALTAQHTHSAPGGYSHYMFYNVTVPDFQPDVFQAIVKAFVESILGARKKIQPGRLKYISGAFPDHEEVAFNRSLEAYNRNPENQPLQPDQTHLAIDRTMYLLKAENLQGEVVSVINWFGVHATSIGPDNQGISSDNKGYAALELEQHFLRQGLNTVCIFAQAAAADVSPNFYGAGKDWPRGKFSSDEESRRFNGRLQADQALRLLSEPESAFSELSPQLDGVLIYADLSDISCDPEFTPGHTDRRTAPAAHGVPFLAGTAIDGKGVSKAVASTIAAFCQVQNNLRLKRLQQDNPELWQREQQDYEMQAPKTIAIETGRRRFLGLEHLGQVPIPERLEPVLAEVQRLIKIGAIKEHSWTPQVLPVQILRIGELALALFPGEVTTTGARRLRKTLLSRLSAAGVTRTVVSGYANAYFGYATTPEEYELQTYEGGHTVFGRWTLPAFQTLYARLSEALLKPDAERVLPESTSPPVFSDQELSLRSGRRWHER